MNWMLFPLPGKWLSAFSDANAYLRCHHRKPFRLQVREGAKLWRRYRCFPYHYFKHRLYEAECRQEVTSFMPPVMVRRYRDRLNPAPAREMTLNKALYTRKMQQAGLPVVPVLAIFGADGWIEDAAGRRLTYEELLERLSDRGLDQVFVKPTHGCEGRNAKKMELHKGRLFLADELLTKTRFFERLFAGSEYDTFLMQPVLRQHELLRQMNSSSVNTVRIDALRMEDGSLRSSGACLRVGNGRDLVDNVSAGGFYIQVDLQTGVLDRYAFGHLKFGKKRVEVHPVSGFRFAGTRLPFWQGVAPLLEEGMRALEPLRYLGWDVAFSEEGLVLMEASADHDLFVLQCAIGGLAERTIGKAVLAAHAC